MSTQSQQIQNFIWMDLEMTGFDPEKHKILEIACIITDTNLQPVHDGTSYIIHQPEKYLNSMNSWSQQQHLKTGLIEASRKSKYSVAEVEKEMCDYIKTYAKGVRYLAGNSVYMDKFFLMKYMPNLDSLLHYRILDVSSLKLICSNWYPEKFSTLKKKELKHRASDDILESIEELKQYREVMFKSTNESF